MIGIVTSEYEELKNTFERIEKWRSIDKAQGRVLDDFGRDRNQHRGVANDEIYRILLKAKVARDQSLGDTNTIIDILSKVLGADKTEIGIEETWIDTTNPEPCGIKIIKLPIALLNEAGMTSKQFAQVVALTVAGGIAVKSIDLQGTFRYGGVDLINDSDSGYSGVDMTTGGFYGALYEPELNQELPI